MNDFLLRWIINTIALVIVVQVVPGIDASGWEAVAVAALILGALNAFVRPLLIVLTMPLQIFSLGIFTLIINGFLLFLVSNVVKGFYVADFMSAFWGALLLSVISLVLSQFLGPKDQSRVRFYSQTTTRRRRPDGDVIDIEAKVEDKTEE